MMRKERGREGIAHAVKMIITNRKIKRISVVSFSQLNIQFLISVCPEFGGAPLSLSHSSSFFISMCELVGRYVGSAADMIACFDFAASNLIQ